jgi:hypothetical protein
MSFQAAIAPLQLGPLFRLHSASWRKLAVAFAEKEFCIAESFLCDALNDDTDYSNAAGIWKAFIKPSLDRRKDILTTQTKGLCGLLSNLSYG